MKSKMYLVEYLGKEESEVVIIRNPKTGEVIKYLTDATELAQFLREDVV